MDPPHIVAYKRREHALALHEASAKQRLADEEKAKFIERLTHKESNPKEAAVRQATMEQELQSFAATLEKVRNARMKALYQGEMAQWQAELEAQGLAIERDVE